MSDSGTPTFDDGDIGRWYVRPDELAGDEPWLWSPGAGREVWATFAACMAGDVDAVRALLARDPSLVRAHYEYRTPLSFAVRANRLAVAELLLDLGAARVGLGDPLEMARERGHDAMTRLLERKLDELHGASERGEPVAAAIRARDLAAVRELLDAEPALLHAGDRSSSRPIHWATMTRQPAMIDELRARGADLDAERMDGARALHLTNGDYGYRGWRDVPEGAPATARETYDHLVRRGATVDVWMAAHTGDLARVRELVDADPSLVNRNNPYNSYYAGCGSPLRNAVAGGHDDVVRLLLARGADPNLPQEHIAPRGGALYAAVYHGRHALARLLLEHGATPDQPAESSADPTWIAIRAGDLPMLELLARHGATWEIPLELPDALSYEAIAATGIGRTTAILAHYGDLTAITARLDADPTLADDPEALGAAAGRGHEAIVRLLLRHRPDLARRVTGSRPPAMAELLFAHGMDPNRPTWTRATPLHRLAERGDVEGATLFLDHGAELEAVDGERRSTPLGWAAGAGRREMAELLLRRGADPRPAHVPAWATPLAWAERHGHAEVAALLRR